MIAESEVSFGAAEFGVDFFPRTSASYDRASLATVLRPKDRNPTAQEACRWPYNPKPYTALHFLGSWVDGFVALDDWLFDAKVSSDSAFETLGPLLVPLATPYGLAFQHKKRGPLKPPHAFAIDIHGNVQ